MECIFCKIIKGEIPSEKILETENIVVFKDINPQARVHLLVVPKKHLKNVTELDEGNGNIVKDMFLAAKKTAEITGISETGYRTIINSGPDSGQEVDHIHLHVLGGEKIGPLNYSVR